MEHGREKPPNTLIEHIDLITRKGHHSKFSDNFQKSVSESAQFVSTYLGITSERQSIWFSILLSLSLRTNVDLDDLTNFLECSILNVMKYMEDIDELVKRKIIRRDKHERRRRRGPDRLNSIRIIVPDDVVQSVLRGDSTLPPRTKQNLNKYELLDVFSNILQEKEHDMLDYREFIEEVEYLLIENDNPFIQQVKRFKLPIDEKIILLHVCSEFVSYESTVDLSRLVKVIFPDTETQLRIRRSFMEMKSHLQRHTLIDLENESFRSDRNICLTTFGMDLFFKEDKDLFIGTQNHQKNIYLHTDIVQKQLFFSEKERKSLDFLTDLLRPDNYVSVVNRMKDMGLRPGFTILFHGYPGTGKTESVYQISKSTERNIKIIEISETKSKWFGQSERLIKEVFVSYRRLVDTEKITPILLFNEIDGVFGTRKTLGSSSVDQTENSIQNIILDSLDQFTGILFGTTNLTKNLDPAFERRFLYKIFFDKPESQTRSFIWRSKIPFLNDEECLKLSEKYDCSGGQIDNIQKKSVMKEILTGLKPTLSEIEEYCEEEFLRKKTQYRKIGFQIS